MAINVNDRNIKKSICELVSSFYCKANNEPYDAVYRFVKLNLKTDKGLKRMVAMGLNCAKRFKDKNLDKYVEFLMTLEKLYFADRKGG